MNGRRLSQVSYWHSAAGDGDVRVMGGLIRSITWMFDMARAR